MMKDHVSGHGTTLSVPAWQSRPFKGRLVKRRKGKGKGKGRGRSKRTGRAFFGDEQAQDPEWWQEEDQVWWSKGKKGKKGLSKGNDGFHKSGFRSYQPDKGAGKDYIPRTKARAKKEKARKEPFLNPDSQPQKHPMKKDMARPWNQEIGLPVTGLRFLNSRCWVVLHRGSYCMDGGNSIESCQPIQHTWFWILAAHCRLDQERQSKDSRSMHGVMASRRNSAVVTNLSCLPTLRQKPARKVASFTFQQFHHVLPRLMCLRQVMPILFFPPSDEKLGYDCWTGSKRRQNYMSSFWSVFLSKWALHNRTNCVGLDESCISANDQVAWLGHPKRHVTFAMSMWTPAYPAHVPDIHKNGNGNGFSWRSQVMMRQAHHWKKKLPVSCSLDPWVLVESVSPHPLAEQAQAWGRLTQADLSWPLAVTSAQRNKTWLHFSIRAYHLCACSCYSSLYRSKNKSSNCTCHPCAGAVLILSVSSLYVALPSAVYSLLNEAAIELTSAVGPVRWGWQTTCAAASRKDPAREKRDLDIDDEDLLPLVPPRPTPAAPVRKRKRTSNMAGPSCYTGTRGIKRLARASRRDLDFRQKRRRWSPE